VTVDADLLALLYATAEDDARWMPVLDQLCRQLDASSAVVQLLDEGTSGVNAAWVARDSRSSANSMQHDRWVNNADNPRLPAPKGPPPAGIASVLEIGSDARLFADDPATLAVVRDRIARAGLGQAFWASFQLSSQRRFSLILHRKPGDHRDLDPAEEGALRQLLPHLQQSVRMATTLADTRSRIETLERTLHHVETGILLCHADLSLVWANTAALELLAGSTAIRVAGGFLRPRERGDTVQLRALVQAALTGEQGNLIATLGANHDFPVHLRAVGSFDRKGSRIASLYLSGPASPAAPASGDIAHLFGLTPAEARLTAAIGAGMTVSEYAEEVGIAVCTARNQLKQVLSKTYTDRQADLVRVLSGSILSRTRP
jgi:DNA-binding CsgD family transcriptional regulator